MPQPETVAEAEYVIGVEGLRAFIEQLTGQPTSLRRASWLIENGTLAVGKLNGHVIARRSAIRQTFERAATEPAPLPATRPPRPVAAVLQQRGVDLLHCKGCGKVFERPPRGRPPLRCPTCRGGGR